MLGSHKSPIDPASFLLALAPAADVLTALPEQDLEYCVSCSTIMATTELDAFGSCFECTWAAASLERSRQWRLRWPMLISSAALAVSLCALLWPLYQGQPWVLGPASVVLMVIMGTTGVWSVHQGIQGRQIGLRSRDRGDRDPRLMLASTASMILGYLTCGVAVIGVSLG